MPIHTAVSCQNHRSSYSSRLLRAADALMAHLPQNGILGWWRMCGNGCGQRRRRGEPVRLSIEFWSRPRSKDRDLAAPTLASLPLASCKMAPLLHHERASRRNKRAPPLPRRVQRQCALFGWNSRWLKHGHLFWTNSGQNVYCNLISPISHGQWTDPGDDLVGIMCWQMGLVCFMLWQLTSVKRQPRIDERGVVVIAKKSYQACVRSGGDLVQLSKERQQRTCLI